MYNLDNFILYDMKGPQEWFVRGECFQGEIHNGFHGVRATQCASLTDTPDMFAQKTNRINQTSYPKN